MPDPDELTDGQLDGLDLYRDPATRAGLAYQARMDREREYLDANMESNRELLAGAAARVKEVHDLTHEGADTPFPGCYYCEFGAELDAENEG